MASDSPVTLNAPVVVRDSGLVGWAENTVHMASSTVNYGFGCIDGCVFSLRQDGERLFLSFVDAGAHMTRHIFNSLRAVYSKKPQETGALSAALLAGRNYDFEFPLSLPLPEGRLDFKAYYDLVCKLMEANFEAGFGITNYARPVFGLSGARIDRSDADFAINPMPCNPAFTFMPEHWGKLLVPRTPSFEGLTVLLVRSSRSPAPNTSHLEFKATGTYGATRGPAVNELIQFNARFGSELGIAHDILLLDHTLQYARELSGANLLAIGSGRVVFTPPCDTTIFPGLTRDFIINRILRGTVGRALDISLTEDAFLSVDNLRTLASRQSELGGMGSALGYIPIKRVIVPKVEDPQSKDDYEVLTFKTGPNTLGALLQSVYGCFSVGNGFRVSTPQGVVEDTTMVSWPLLFEIPKELHDQARKQFMCVGGKEYDLPLDQIMRSERVTSIRCDARVVPFKGIVRCR